jgi:hypothetical protein
MKSIKVWSKKMLVFSMRKTTKLTSKLNKLQYILHWMENNLSVRKQQSMLVFWVEKMKTSFLFFSFLSLFCRNGFVVVVIVCFERVTMTIIKTEEINRPFVYVCASVLWKKNYSNKINCKRGTLHTKLYCRDYMLFLSGDASKFITGVSKYFNSKKSIFFNLLLFLRAGWIFPKQKNFQHSLSLIYLFKFVSANSHLKKP